MRKSISTKIAKDYLHPNNPTKKLLERTSKDQTLFRYIQFFLKRDFYDRYKGLALFLLFMAYIASITSTYLSQPYVYESLEADVPNENFRYYVSWCFLLLLEVVKHITVVMFAKTVFTYHEKPFLSLPILLLCGYVSYSFCINGVTTDSENNYLPPPPTTTTNITTIYDPQIEALTATNETLFERNQWKGKLNAESRAGKAYAENELKLTELRTKQTASIEKQKSNIEEVDKETLEAYDRKHQDHTNFRYYISYFLEPFIIFASLFFMYFMFTSGKEHSARILSRSQPSTTGKEAEEDVTLLENNSKNNTNNSNRNKEITNYDYEDLTNLIKEARKRRNAYRYKLKNNIGTSENNSSKIAYFEKEINRLTALQQQFQEYEVS